VQVRSLYFLIFTYSFVFSFLNPQIILYLMSVLLFICIYKLYIVLEAVRSTKFQILPQSLILESFLQQLISDAIVTKFFASCVLKFKTDWIQISYVDFN
jgi:hypothetical protein